MLHHLQRKLRSSAQSLDFSEREPDGFVRTTSNDGTCDGNSSCGARGRQRCSLLDRNAQKQKQKANLPDHDCFLHRQSHEIDGSILASPWWGAFLLIDYNPGCRTIVTAQMGNE